MPPRTGGSEPAEGIFRDVAKEAGLDFRWGHGGKAPLTILETIGHGCAFLDYDQDGLLDALLVSDQGGVLFRNTGDGRFENVTPLSGLVAEGPFFGVAVGDYDNDRFPDLYLTGYGKCRLYHNRGARRSKSLGTDNPTSSPLFEDVTAKAGVGARGPHDVVTAAAFADLDGDGRLDLFAGRYILFTPSSVQYCFYSGVKAGCGVKNYDPDYPTVYRNNGNGAFTDVTEAWGFGASSGKCLGVAVRAADQGNGVILYAANDEMQGDLFVRDGARYKNLGVPSATAFNRDGLTQAGMGTDWGDFNNDSRLDLVVATFQNEPSSLYRNDGNGLYAEVGGPLGIAADTSPYVGWTVRYFDYDNDGWLDLLTTNGHVQDNVHAIDPTRSYPQPTLLFRNEGGRQYRNVSTEGGPPFSQPIVGRGAAFGDYDNDGKIDVLIVNEEGPSFLLHNETKTSGHWIGVRLVGVKSNRDGVGARVTVTAGDNTYTRDMSLCGGYISGHDPRLHFGLGESQRIGKLVVRWPNGRVDTLRDLPVDKYVTVTEGAKTVR
jgi:enediyne biosynthesis protein E4